MSTSSLAFKGEKLTGKNNYLEWLPEAKLFLEVNGFMPFIDNTIKAPNKSLYYKTIHDTKRGSSTIVEDEIPRTPELGIRYIEKLDEYERNKKKAYGAIKSILSLDVIDRFKDKTDATKLWEAILQTYGETSFELIGRYFNKLLESDFNYFNSLDKYTSNIQASYIYLKELKQEIPKALIIWILLKGLPSSFESFSSRKFEELSKTLKDPNLSSNLNIDEFISDIISEESRIKASDLEANRISSKYKTKQKNSKYCTYCNKEGHLENQCYKQYPELRRNNTSNKARNTSNTFTNNNPEDKSSSNFKKESPRVLMTSLANKGRDLGINRTRKNKRLVLDSGASEHYTPIKEWLINYKPVFNKSILVANGQRINIEGIGDIPVITNNKEVLITKVNYVPSLKTTLLSSKELVNKGWEIFFKKNIALLSSKIDNSLKVIAKWDKNAYCFTNIAIDDNKLNKGSKVVYSTTALEPTHKGLNKFNNKPYNYKRPYKAANKTLESPKEDYNSLKKDVNNEIISLEEKAYTKTSSSTSSSNASFSMPSNRLKVEIPLLKNDSNKHTPSNISSKEEKITLTTRVYTDSLIKGENSSNKSKINYLNTDNLFQKLLLLSLLRLLKNLDIIIRRISPYIQIIIIGLYYLNTFVFHKYINVKYYKGIN